MRQNLMKKTAIYSTLFSAAAFGVIFYVICIGEAANGRVGSMEGAGTNTGNQIASTDTYYTTNSNVKETQLDNNALTFELGTADTNYLCIPLPPGTGVEEITVENHYMDTEMWIAIRGARKKFYETAAISGNRKHIVAGTYEAVDTGIILKFSLTDIYEYRSILENNKLYIEFVSPREIYNRIIVVDPAFGGSVAGFESNDLKEKDVTLAIAKKLKQKLDDTDIKVYYTRMEDNGPTEEQRVTIANDTKADMLIRIEANADSDSMVYGTIVIYNENFFIPGFGNVELADILEKEVVSVIKGKAVGLKAAAAEDYVIWKATVPAAAIRVGYLTNVQEAILLKKEDYIDKIATGIYYAIMKAYEE